MKTLALLLALGFGLSVLPRAQEDAAPALPRTVVLVRHAETAASTMRERDPALSEAGEARAEALARLLARTEAALLLASPYARTQATLAPLAAALGGEVRTLPPDQPEAYVEAVRKLPPGAVAVVAGHSNTLPLLGEALGAPLPGLEEDARLGRVIAHDAYDRLFVVTLPESGAPGVLELRYGD